jgi:hypothetical protein
MLTSFVNTTYFTITTLRVIIFVLDLRRFFNGKHFTTFN